jgi:predicted Zn-dependent protease
MKNELRNAEDAIARGRTDEALQLLWNALEQARLNQDRESLEAILRLARRLEGSDAKRLASDVEPLLPDSEATPRARPPSSNWRRSALIAALLIVAAVGGVKFGLPLLTGPVGPPIELDENSLPTEPVAVKAPGVYLVPIGRFASVSQTKLATDLARRHQVPTSTLPALPLTRYAVDEERDQLVSERLIELLRRQYPVRHPRAVVIGLTQFDMYIRQASWNYAFSLRSEPSYAVVSTARMDPVNYGDAADRELLEARLRKMVAKNIGVLYLRLPLNSNPRSLLYDRILGPDDLDRMTEEFKPED